MIELNLQSYQLVIELNVVRWGDTDLGQKVMEVRDSQKQYTNDIAEIQQIVDIGRVTEESHRILIIINIKRDLDNPGDKIIL